MTKTEQKTVDGKAGHLRAGDTVVKGYRTGKIKSVEGIGLDGRSIVLRYEDGTVLMTNSEIPYTRLADRHDET